MKHLISLLSDFNNGLLIVFGRVDGVNSWIIPITFPITLNGGYIGIGHPFTVDSDREYCTKFEILTLSTGRTLTTGVGDNGLDYSNLGVGVPTCYLIIGT